MGARLTRQERRWLDDRATRLRRMIAALDDDLERLEPGDWSRFWSDMRRLYSRTAMHMETALHTSDRGCLTSSRGLWREIEDCLLTAQRRLHG